MGGTACLSFPFNRRSPWGPLLCPRTEQGMQADPGTPSPGSLRADFPWHCISRGSGSAGLPKSFPLLGRKGEDIHYVIYFMLIFFFFFRAGSLL